MEVGDGGLHRYPARLLSAALELAGKFRVNVVSPTMVEDSVETFAELFPDLNAMTITDPEPATAAAPASTGAGAAVRLDDLRLGFHGKLAAQVTLDIEPGEVVVFLGGVR